MKYNSNSVWYFICLFPSFSVMQQQNPSGSMVGTPAGMTGTGLQTGISMQSTMVGSSSFQQRTNQAFSEFGNLTK